MLENLKRDITNEKNKIFVVEESVKHASDDDDDIKDAFLDDIDLQLTGSEDDPEIEKLVNDLPDIEDDEIDLEDIEENYIPETILTNK
jgi:hypothetical protein